MILDEYINGLISILDRIRREQAAHIRAASRIVAETLSNDGIIHTFGTGHSHIIAEEAFFRAGGIAPINPILHESTVFLNGALESTRIERQSGFAASLLANETVNEGDAAIIISNSGRNAAPVEMALEMKARNAKVIAITSLEQSKGSTSRHSSGKRLFEIADVTIDNCVPPGDALVKITGSGAAGASSTVAGAAIIHSIIVEALIDLSGQGKLPAIFPSANLENTKAMSLQEIIRPYAGRIRLFDPDTIIDA